MSFIHSKRLGRLSFIILALLFMFLSQAKISAEEFKRALPGKVFSFPRDHYAHPEFRTEWWYYTGHLQSPQKDRSFGYQLTFFRSGLKRETKKPASKWSIQDLYFAHLALTNETGKKFDYREKINRGSLGEAGASDKDFRVWIEDWFVEAGGTEKRDHLLKAKDRDFGIELILTPERNPVIHGLNGISQKAEGEGYASYYYSVTRLKTEGKLLLGKKEIPVSGLSWMDHEFGSSQLREYQVGWDWFSIQLENGTDLMLYQIRQKGGNPDPYSSGTIIFPDGKQKHLSLREFQIEVLDKWKSKKSGATYPSGWKVRVPGHGIELTLLPTLKDQELMTGKSTRVTYWEGSVNIEGKLTGSRVKGKGYVELTGDAMPFAKGI